jgi:hypothetical protein
MIPDPEKLAVAWAKADVDLQAVNGERVATRLPQEWGGATFLTVFVVDGQEDVEAPLGDKLLQWDCRARGSSQNQPPYPQAMAVALVLADKARQVESVNVGGGWLYGFHSITGPRRMEDPATGFARYTVEMRATIR